MRWILAAVVAALVAGLGLGAWYWMARVPAKAQAPSVARAVPVQVAAAVRADVPVYLPGLGNVQAFNTVTIRTQVDGQIQKIAFTEGQDVKSGDLLVQIDPRPFQATLDQAVAKKAQDEAQLANARHDLERYMKLAPSNSVSQQIAETQKALVAQLEATVRGDQAAIDFAAVQLGFTSITSPLDGRLGIRLVDQGNIVHTTDTTGVVVVTQLQPISVIFTLPEDNLPEITRELATGTLRVVAYSRDKKTKLDEGTLSVIDNEIDVTAATIRLKATFPNADYTLWPGQFVNAQLLLRIQRNVVTVPSTAVQRGAQGLFAYAIKPDSTVELRWLKVGKLDTKTAVIEEGIQEGERVVTSGQYQLQPGTHVDVRPTQTATTAPERTSP
jgi:multidrug efflux system membrane fusion protein